MGIGKCPRRGVLHTPFGEVVWVDWSPFTVKDGVSRFIMLHGFGRGGLVFFDDLCLERNRYPVLIQGVDEEQEEREYLLNAITYMEHSFTSTTAPRDRSEVPVCHSIFIWPLLRPLEYVRI